MRSRHIVLLRAVNVGGTGRLKMSELSALCERAGFTEVTTYIQSGNVVLSSDGNEDAVKAALEKALAKKLGKPAGVLVRSAQEIRDVLAKSPFAAMPPNRVIVFFVDETPAQSMLAEITGQAGEEVALGRREIYVYYPNGQGVSKLKLPWAKTGTGRNVNTITKLAEMAG
ncbi:MAG: DUF1697 domain-containing protein [Deltaproteobacteria bacterium]|nr:DUF1697 domain-containing protein [Deltaproteobacteria bacterium]